MKIPKQVKVGGLVYKIVVADTWDDSAGYDGECVNDKKRGNLIYIRENLSTDAQAITLIHEAMHGMNSTINHEFLDSLAEQLYAFFKDNNLLK